jgi:hypothetical protein
MAVGEVVPEFDWAMSEFANKVQRWAFNTEGARYKQTGKWMPPTFGDAASALRVPVQQIADAVEFHYWMFTLDDDLPLAMRRIEHEGE